MDIAVRPATLERFDDVAAILGPRRENAKACWCLYYRLSSSTFNAIQGPERPAYVRRLCSREPAPGMVAYIADQPVGWCALGPRSDMGRLERSRTIPRVDERPAWSVVCFVVRAGHRRRGVARALLDGAIAYATECHAELLEGYPVETGGERISAAFAYVGTTRMFEAAGFERVQMTASRTARRPRWLMRRELPDGRS
jgi:GNAT superfamily N-acetyltransferase